MCHALRYDSRLHGLPFRTARPPYEICESQVKAPLIFLALFFAMVSARDALAAAGRPNLVFILADDLGWSDTTLYGTTRFYETPNIARLAERGMLFHNAYTAHPLCSPTRSSIMTGLDPARTGFTSAAGHTPNVLLDKTLMRAGEALSKSSNSEEHFATRYEDTRLSPRPSKRPAMPPGISGNGIWDANRISPLKHGFDIRCAALVGAGACRFLCRPWRFPKELDFDPATPNEHIEDRMATEAVAFIEKNQGQSRSF